MRAQVRCLFALSAAAGVILAAGCGGRILSPVGGTWTYTQPASGVLPPMKITVDLEDDGNVDQTLTFGAPISGAMHVSGLSWSVSSNTMTISGTPSCSGGFTAGAGSPRLTQAFLTIFSNHVCSSPRLPVSSALDPNAAPIPNGFATMVVGTACNYTLSNDDDTLTLEHCEESLATAEGSDIYPGVSSSGPRSEYVDYTLHAN
jgi:hypothetical protein